jgi:hypothetical protein
MTSLTTCPLPLLPQTLIVAVQDGPACRDHLNEGIALNLDAPLDLTDFNAPFTPARTDSTDSPATSPK